MHLDAMIEELGKKVDIPDLQFNEDGVITLEYNEKYTTNIEKSEDQLQITVYGVIGKLPQDNRESCLLALLETNLFGQETHGASFGLDSDTQDIYISKTLDTRLLTFDLFFEEFSHFLQVQQEWTDKLESKEYLTSSKSNHSI